VHVVKKLGLLFLLVILLGVLSFIMSPASVPDSIPKSKEGAYWFILHRKSNKEYLYKGNPGVIKESELIKKFIVKTGIPGERPTPLPNLVGKEYWVITNKVDSSDNPETAPYFLSLNIPAPTDLPFGPEPYLECGGIQCQWDLPGEFGLHGVNGDDSRLSKENLGSSGCIRHTDSDITFLYNVLQPEKDEIRYYIKDI
jgi:hypothetical protein